MKGICVGPLMKSIRGDQKGSSAYTFLGFVVICAVVIGAAVFVPWGQMFRPGEDPDIAAGNAAMAKKDWDKAIASYSKSIKNNPANASAYVSRARAYVQQGNLDKAIADATVALQKSPNNSTAYGQRAVAYKLLQQYDKALQDLDNAIRIDGGFAWAYAQRADLHMKQKSLDKALQDVNLALQKKPNFVEAHRLRAWVLSSMGNCKEAWEDFARVEKLTPNDAFSLQDKAWFLMTCPNEQLQDTVKAMELAKKAMELTDGKDGVVLETLAEAHFRQGDPAKAAELQKKAIELGSRNCPDNSCVKEMQQRLQKYELAARQEVRKNYEILPTDSQL
jgi:tetratricopeptide (TPR) repeat protein